MKNHELRIKNRKPRKLMGNWSERSEDPDLAGELGTCRDEAKLTIFGKRFTHSPIQQINNSTN